MVHPLPRRYKQPMARVVDSWRMSVFLCIIVAHRELCACLTRSPPRFSSRHHTAFSLSPTTLHRRPVCELPLPLALHGIR